MNSSWPPHSDQQGFTLLEMMVAIGIFALASAGLFQLLGQSARHAEYLENRYFAELYAQNHLVELYLAKEPPESGEVNGQVQLGGRTYRWRQQVEATANDGFRRATLQVQSDDDQTLATLSLFVGIEP